MLLQLSVPVNNRSQEVLEQLIDDIVSENNIVTVEYNIALKDNNVIVQIEPYFEIELDEWKSLVKYFTEKLIELY